MRPFSTLLLAASIVAAQDSDLDRGRKIYEGHCALCHGQTGTGGRGPSLAIPKLKRAATEEQLIQVIAEGVRGTEMPGAWQLHEREVKLVAAFVRSLGRVERIPLPGNPTAGKQLFAGKAACASCHIVQGEGTANGPELTLVGLRRNPEYLREALLKPGATAPDDYLFLELTTATGAKIRGNRANEDNFNIQLMDSAGKFHSFRKGAVKEIKRLEGESAMPSYQGKLSATELDDIIAYLASLRGE